MVGGSLLLLFAVDSVTKARADVWLSRDGSGTLRFTNVPTAANTMLLFRDLPPAHRQRQPGARSTLYDSLIETVAARHDVEVALVKAVVKAESGFNPRAVSPKGARGLMQLMPGTAVRHGVRNVFSASENLEGGVEHLRMLLDYYSGNQRLALAAYNAGTGAVEAAGRQVPPYAETREYIRRVLWYRAAYLRDAAAHPVLSRR